MKRKIQVAVVLLVFLIFFSLASFAYINISLDEPYSGLKGNTVNDLAYDPDRDIVWIATGRGVTKYENGEFLTYDETNGLNASQIAALAISDSSVWVATSYSKVFEGEVIPYGAGFNLTSDDGDSWQSIEPEQASRVGQLAYDLEAKDSTIWAACWYGGLIRSTDGGENWENLFVDTLAQKDYELGYYDLLRNRFFSVAIDTTPSKEQRRKNEINDIAWDGRIFWVGTPKSLRFTTDSLLGETWFSYDTSYGLNYNSVSALACQCMHIGADTLDTLLWVATSYFEEVNGDTIYFGGGFNRTSDYGSHWDTLTPEQALGSGKVVWDMATLDSTVWAACDSGGLIKSKYEGDNIVWETIFDKSPVRSVWVRDESSCTFLWIGTADSGIYEFNYPDGDTTFTVKNYTSQNGLSGDSVVSVRFQSYVGTNIIWAATAPTSLGGYYGVSKSTDSGTTWSTCLSGEKVRDLAFVDSVVFVATSSGIKRSYDYGGTWEDVQVIDNDNNFKPLYPGFRSFLVTGDTLLAGSVDGLCWSSDVGNKWKVYKYFITYNLALWAGTAAGIYKFIFTDSDSADTVLSYYYSSDDTTSEDDTDSDNATISGNFVVALDVQEYGDQKIVWAGTQPAYEGYYGVSRTTDDGESWEVFLDGDKAWNFDFDDSVVWAATSSGLKRSYDFGETWEVFKYISDQENPDQKILSEEYYAVVVVGDSVWAGNFDGLVRIKKDASPGDAGDVFRVKMSAPQAYAYPSPFSPYFLTGKTRIRFDVQKPGEVKVKIYDFAMNLVTTKEHQCVETEGCEALWDGRNDKGDVVANGVYFFKIESSGKTQWGKVVVIK